MPESDALLSVSLPVTVIIPDHGRSEIESRVRVVASGSCSGTAGTSITPTSIVAELVAPSASVTVSFRVAVSFALTEGAVNIALVGSV
jgi:hypothetical protein